MNNEYVYFVQNVGMVTAEPTPGHLHKVAVDNAEEAAAFWNAHADDCGGLIRDPYNNHYWATAAAREKMSAAAEKVAPVEQGAASEQISETVIHSHSQIRPATATQVWEPCDQCSAEPSYLTATGNFCVKHL